MQTIISLKHFALTGNFGGVSIGMKRNMAVRLLGRPDADNDFGHGSSGLMYAWYELFYDSLTHKITGIQNDHLMVRDKAHKADIYFETSKARIDKWFLKYTKNLSYNNTLALLDKEKIRYSVMSYLDSNTIRFPGGVDLDFDTEPKSGQNVLNGIRLFQR